MSLNVVTIVSDTLRPDHLGFNQRSGVKWTAPPGEAGQSASADGAWIRTPAIDHFAARSVSFDRAFCGSFPTIPMRTDLFTGRSTFVSREWSPIPAGEATLPGILGQAGYVTQLIADTAHLFRADFHSLFSAWDWQRGQEGDRVTVSQTPVQYPCDPRKLRADRGTPLCEHGLRNRTAYRLERDWSVSRACESACDWLEAHHHIDSPFYLHLDLFDPHESWDAPEWYASLYDPGYEGEKVLSPDYAVADFLTERELRHARALYAAEVTQVDRWLGRVFDKLDDLDLFQNTVVLFLSDHGFNIGEHGLSGKHGIKPYHTWPFYKEVSNIVCLASVPGLAHSLEGSRSNALVQPVDVLPTLLELTGLAGPEAKLGEPGGPGAPAVSGKLAATGAPGTALHGHSLAPLLRAASSEEARDLAVRHARRVAVTSGALSTDPRRAVHSSITDGEWLLVEAGPSRAAVLLELDQPAGITTGGEVIPHNQLGTHLADATRLHALSLDLLERAGTSGEKLDLRRDLTTGAALPATAIGEGAPQ